MRHPVFSALALVGLVGCGGSDGKQQQPDAGLVTCQTAAERTMPCTVTVVPELLQFETQNPPEFSVQLAYNTAWDVPQRFPTTCEPLALAVADSSNGFRPRLDNVSCASSNPRIIMLMADDVIGGNRYALSINDKKLPAPVAGVRTLDPMRIYVVKQATLDTWRKALGLSGLDWTHYGMAVVIYRDRTLNPVAGIRPTKTVPDGADPFLKPGSEVFFLSADRERVEIGATATTASGVALFPLVGNRSLDVSGTTGAGFEFVGLSAPPGGLFIEACDQI